jgi:nucleotide-binding universal stress UspA family protein
MYERILVAVDGSATSELALDHAIELAKAMHARLRIVHVVDELAMNIGPVRTPDEFWKAACKAGESLLEASRASAAKGAVDAETRLLKIRTLGGLVRHVADKIAEEAERWPADLVVIGTHGRRGLSKLFLGSVAQGVTRLCNAPVLLVRGVGRKARRARARSR